MGKQRKGLYRWFIGLLAATLINVSACVPVLQPSPSPQLSDDSVIRPTSAPTLASGDRRYLGVNQVQGLVFADADTLWAATTGGVARWNLVTGDLVHYTTDDGLASNWVNDVAQAPDGSLWFATLGGVNRLGTQGWAHYTTADGLADDAVQAIAAAEDGTIWVGTTGGIGRFDGQTWTTHFPQERAWQIDIAPDGTVWFAGDGAGLRRYAPDDDVWSLHTREVEFPPGVKTVSVDPGGGVWTYLGYDQLYRFDNREWQPVYDTGGTWICDAAFEPDGTPWIGTCSGYHAHGTGLLTRAEDTWRQVGPEQGLASGHVNAVEIGPEGQIAAGTTRGLSLDRDGKWRTLRHGPVSNRVTTVAVTSDGTAWFGFGDNSFYPAGGGISRFNGQTWETINQRTGLPISDNIRLLTVDPNGTLWAAGGCSVAYRDQGTWHRVVGCEHISGNVLDIAFGPEGVAWIASAFQVTRVDGESVETWEDLLPISIAVAADGTALIEQSSLGDGGLWIFEGDLWQPLTGNQPCAGKLWTGPSDSVWATACDGGGFYKWDEGRWVRTANADDVPAGRIIDVEISANGEVWVATERGLGHSGPEGWARHERSWWSDIHDMAVAPDGSVWLATTQGAVHLTQP